MASELGFTSLYKALKDQMRKKIIIALSENDSLSYTDLMNILKIDSTGRLNYHLKIMHDLIAKKENGEYVLTEKGKLAWRLLSEFPDVDNSHSKYRQFWITAGFGQVVILISILCLYFLRFMNFLALFQGLITVAVGMTLTYFANRAQGIRLPHGSDKERLLMRTTYTMIGAWAGGMITFFGGGLLIVGLAKFLNKSSLLTGIWGSWFLVIAFVVAPLTGGISGYLLGKRRGFQKIELIKRLSTV